MRLNVRVDQIVLDGLDLNRGERAALSQAVEREIGARLLAVPGLRGARLVASPGRRRALPAARQVEVDRLGSLVADAVDRALVTADLTPAPRRPVGARR